MPNSSVEPIIIEEVPDVLPLRRRARPTCSRPETPAYRAPLAPPKKKKRKITPAALSSLDIPPSAHGSDEEKIEEDVISAHSSSHVDTLVASPNPSSSAALGQFFYDPLPEIDSLDLATDTFSKLFDFEDPGSFSDSHLGKDSPQPEAVPKPSSPKLDVPIANPIVHPEGGKSSSPVVVSAFESGFAYQSTPAAVVSGSSALILYCPSTSTYKVPRYFAEAIPPVESFLNPPSPGEPRKTTNRGPLQPRVRRNAGGNR